MSIVEDCGIKVVRLSSPIVLKNSFEIPLDVCIQESLHDEKLHTQVKPNATVGVSL